MVDAYFHPIRITYPIQPGPFFQAAPNTLFLRIFRKGQTYLLSTLLLAAASRHHEESHLIYGPLESILLGQGFLVDYELHEFNPPHTETNLCHLQNWLC